MFYVKEDSLVRQPPTTSSSSSSADELFKMLLKVGEELLDKDADLYKTAVARLQSNVPREPSPVRRAAGAEMKGVKSDSTRRASTAFPKYRLPGDYGAKEFYQCMECNERRTTNSFHADHQHGATKYVVRWYCPICNLFYAVTHRGYHIRKRHGSPGSVKGGVKRKARSLSPVHSEEPDDESGEEEQAYAPAGKKPHSGHPADDSDATDPNPADLTPTVQPPPPPTQQPKPAFFGTTASPQGSFIGEQPFTRSMTSLLLSGGIPGDHAGDPVPPPSDKPLFAANMGSLVRPNN